MVTGTINNFRCEKIYTDNTSTSFAITQDFKEIEFCTSDATVNATQPCKALRFAKGQQIKKRVGWYTNNTNFSMLDIAYNGDKNFTITLRKQGNEVTPHSNVYIFT